MVQIEVAYRGQLRCTAKHGPSGMSLTTDAPLDNHGRGEAFSPTDLVATALGTCMVTTMGIRCKQYEAQLEGTQIVIDKHMTSAPPRRIARLQVEVRVPRGAELSQPARKELEHAAHTCPVRLSLADSVDVPVQFSWGAA